MNVEIRIYKRHDLDLFALHDAGYSLGRIMHKAVSAYASGKPIHIELEYPSFFDLNGKSSYRLRFRIPETETDTIRLLKGIKHGYRNSFCKMVLRESLSHQNLTSYFSKDIDVSAFQKDAQNTSVVSGTLQSAEENKRKRMEKVFAETVSATTKAQTDEPESSFMVQKDPVILPEIPKERTISQPVMEHTLSSKDVENDLRADTEDTSSTDQDLMKSMFDIMDDD